MELIIYWIFIGANTLCVSAVCWPPISKWVAGNGAMPMMLTVTFSMFHSMSIYQISSCVRVHPNNISMHNFLQIDGKFVMKQLFIRQ